MTEIEAEARAYIEAYRTYPETNYLRGLLAVIDELRGEIARLHEHVEAIEAQNCKIRHPIV